MCVCVYRSIPRKGGPYTHTHTHTQNVSCNLRNIADIIIQSIHKSPYPEISVWTSATILNITRHNIWDAFVIICVHFFPEKRNANNRLLRYFTKRNVCNKNVTIEQGGHHDVTRSRYTMLREAVLSVVFFIITQHGNVFKTTGPRSTGVNAGTENSDVRLAYFMGIGLRVLKKGGRGKLLYKLGRRMSHF